MIKFIRQIKHTLILLKEFPRRLDKLEQAVGNIQTSLERQNNSKVLQDHEFQVYSQSGEDGIIQFLLHQIGITYKIFVEFGVERYTESNTRFLLIHNNWSGMVIDGLPSHIDFIKQDRLYWQQALTAVHAFIDKDNINELISGNGITGPIGLLSVDIDGNDYWVWQAINCVDPVIVVCEYNSLFGPTRKVTVPYDKQFIRSKAHHSHVYYGASLAALTHLAQEKGYILVGVNSRGNNVFFVKAAYAQLFQAVTPEQVYVRAQFREGRDIDGNLNFMDFEQAREAIRDLPLYDIETEQLIRVKDL